MTYMRDQMPEPVAKPKPVAAPYTTFEKNKYRVVNAGSQLRVEEWSEPSQRWNLKLFYAADRFRVVETPVRFEIYRKTGDEKEPATDAPLMDRATMANKMRDARWVQSIQLRAMNLANRLRHGQNTGNGR